MRQLSVKKPEPLATQWKMAFEQRFLGGKHLCDRDRTRRDQFKVPWRTDLLREFSPNSRRALKVDTNGTKHVARCRRHNDVPQTVTHGTNEALRPADDPVAVTRRVDILGRGFPDQVAGAKELLSPGGMGYLTELPVTLVRETRGKGCLVNRKVMRQTQNAWWTGGNFNERGQGQNSDSSGYLKIHNRGERHLAEFTACLAAEKARGEGH